MKDNGSILDNAALLRLATNASVLVACLLIGVKFGAWLATDSVSVLASLVDSLMDSAASVINLLAVRYSLKMADEDHRFGHGKAESLAGIGQACFIAGSALVLVMQGVERLTNPLPVQSLATGVGVMVFAIVATLVLLAIQRRVIVKTNSAAIRADSLHYVSDLLTNTCTILALILSSWGWKIIDPLFSLGIALFILHGAWRIGNEAFQLLMDRQLPEEQCERIAGLARNSEYVLGVHDLRTRQSGQTSFIQLHLELDDQMVLRQAHAVAKQVERKILDLIPDADVIIHQDPITPEEAPDGPRFHLNCSGELA